LRLPSRYRPFWQRGFRALQLARCTNPRVWGRNSHQVATRCSGTSSPARLDAGTIWRDSIAHASVPLLSPAQDNTTSQAPRKGWERRKKTIEMGWRAGQVARKAADPRDGRPLDRLSLNDACRRRSTRGEQRALQKRRHHNPPKSEGTRQRAMAAREMRCPI
jgi:hypothetical protein